MKPGPPVMTAREWFVADRVSADLGGPVRIESQRSIVSRSTDFICVCVRCSGTLGGTETDHRSANISDSTLEDAADPYALTARAVGKAARRSMCGCPWSSAP